MKQLACALLTVFALSRCVMAGTDLTKWKLVWSDEFNGKGLVDSSKWGYEKGFIRNNEAQYYTAARTENARMEGGRLIIEGRKEPFDKAQYTAASINTRGKFALTYGRVEVRAKLPRGRGMWPAIWMLGTNIGEIGWPRCGEIDIMEFVGFAPDKVHATVHWYDREAKRHTSKGTALDGQKPSEDFHIYAVEWFADRMDFYYDQTKYFTYPISAAGKEGNPFDKPHYLLINLAIGGGWGGQKGIDDSIFPQRYEIDYVRIYKAR